MKSLSGELNFANAGRVLRELSPPDDGHLDLGGVTRVDSAGVALLLELSRRAAAQGRKLTLVNINDQIRGLLQFFELDRVLLIDG